MNTKLIGAFAVLLIGVLAFAGTAAGQSDKDSKVTLAVGAKGFLGSVSSDTKQCTQGRTVKVLKRKNHRETLIGHTTTNANGGWAIQRKRVRPGSYLAKVIRTPADSSGIHCGGDRSGRVKYGK